MSNKVQLHWYHWFYFKTRIGVFAQGQILCISPYGLQAGHCDPPPPPFWMTENEFRSHFSPFQIKTQLLITSFDFVHTLTQNGCRRPFWMTENHFWSHFSPFQINRQLWFFLFTKWLPAADLDDRKSLLIAFLDISDQYATLIIFLIFTKWLPGTILYDRKSLSNAFLAISDQYNF